MINVIHIKNSLKSKLIFLWQMISNYEIDLKTRTVRNIM